VRDKLRDEIGRDVLDAVRGTSTRRTAVHFWPVFCVMSSATFDRNSP
jgi:hypothetical protein